VINEIDIIDALTKCSGYDAQHTPVPDDSGIVVDAWMEHFSRWPLITRQDLLSAVTEYHTSAHTEQLVPAHLSAVARKYTLDRIERSDLDSDERRRQEALCDAKAAPELRAIEGARQRAIESYAHRFGIAPTEAEVRMTREWCERNDLDAVRVATAHLRQERPPQPVPCPDCGAIARCEHDNVEHPDEIA
jgi:hypothetical protein